MKIIWFVLFLLFAMPGYGQNDFFSPPVKIPLNLSANFAELRENHFHSGIDIKTNRQIGIPVNSVADGHVSRIAVSPSGFGKALYIDHPNGTTSVYAHLHKFSDAIEEYIKNIQYSKKSFKVDIQLKNNEFVVVRDEIIAYSGNSGSSGGPHLHFEIRDTKTEEPLNPLKFNFEIKDQTPPKIYSILVTPLGKLSHVNYQPSNEIFQAVFYDGAFHLNGNPVIPVYGQIGFAIQTNDYFDDSWNQCGIYSLKLKIDGELYYSFEMDRFSFNETRYINSHIDFKEFKTSGRKYIKAWKDPGNRLQFYDYLREEGICIFNDGNIHDIRFELTDAHENTSSINFRVRSIYKNCELKEELCKKVFVYDRKNHFRDDEFYLDIPEGSFYNDFGFNYDTAPRRTDLFSKVHVVHTDKIPLHKTSTLGIKTLNLPEMWQEKALLVKVDTISGKLYAAGGSFEKGWVKSSIREFGNYAVAVDIVPPQIRSLSIKNYTELTESDRIRFRISDELSGIEKIEGFIDGKWALFEYDAKSKLITHYFDKTRFELNQQHNLKISVTDYKGNTSTYEATFRK
jgi:hypothetical protein